MNRFHCLVSVLIALAAAIPARAGTPAEIEAMRNDQLPRLIQYVRDAIQPNGLVRDAVTTAPGSSPFHPATPDAAGFALLALAAADHLGLAPDAEALAEQILRAYAGDVPGVTPQRSANGHWVHFMNVNTGIYQPGWDSAYSPIGSALIVTGAQFAANHWIENTTIGDLAQELSDTTDFNAAIHPALDGRIWLSVGASGNGDASFGAVSPWNEYMLVMRLALREADNSRAIAVAPAWMNPFNLPTRSYAGFATLTDNPANYAPAFWVQQQYYFNADFAGNPAFVHFYENHRDADAAYCTAALNQPYRYGLTAGVNPSGYRADRIGDQEFVFAPEAVAAFGDMDTLCQWFADQPPASDGRLRYGMLRASAAQPSWLPPDTGLVDHLFLMFGLVESADPLFFRQRQPGQTDADADGIADAFDNCPTFNPDQGPCGCSVADITTDGTSSGVPDGVVTLSDFSYFLSLWSMSDPAADITVNGICDVAGGGGDGVTLSDFSCYLSEWSAGCP
ncbi:MAG: GC-type dockerin domain-anchored protein [Planctomycetota bacterium]